MSNNSTNSFLSIWKLLFCLWKYQPAVQIWNFMPLFLYIIIIIYYLHGEPLFNRQNKLLVLSQSNPHLQHTQLWKKLKGAKKKCSEFIAMDLISVNWCDFSIVCGIDFQSIDKNKWTHKCVAPSDYLPFCCLLLNSLLARKFAEKIVSVWIVPNKHIVFIWLVYGINQQIKQLPFPIFKFKWRNKKITWDSFLCHLHSLHTNQRHVDYKFLPKIYKTIITI